MTSKSQSDNTGKGLPAGSHHYRAFVGSPKTYDLQSAIQFNLLTFLGLRQDHFLLDIGCGSLSAGKLFITYLLPGHYFGIEPEQWLIEEGINNELGRDIINIKAPVFSNDSNFTCTAFDQKFDFVLAYSIFTHASQEQITRCISQVKECMKPTSIFVANFISGQENYTGNDWVYPGCISYTSTHMVELVVEHGLICRLYEPAHQPDQGPATWVLIGYPGNEERISDLVDNTELVLLRNQLNIYKERLSTLQEHPYVKFGRTIGTMLSRIKLLLR